MRKLKGKFWTRRLIRGAESRGMEDPGTGAYREARMRKGQGEPRRFVYVQQKILSKGKIHVPYSSAISRLPWNLLAHGVSPSSSAVAPLRYPSSLVTCYGGV